MRLANLKYLLGVLLLPWSAWGQNRAIPSFQLNRLDLNSGGGASLLIGTGELLSKDEFRLSFIGEYEHRPLIYYPDQGPSVAVVRSRIENLLAAAYSPLSWLEIGFNLPVIAYQSSDNLSALGLRSIASAGLGSPVLTGRLQLATVEGGAPVNLATQLGVGIPIGSSQALVRDSGAALNAKLMIGRAFRQLHAGMELGTWLRPKTSLSGFPNAKDEVGSELQAGGTIAWVGPRASAELSARAGFPFTRQSAALEVLGGGRHVLNSTFELFALGGPGLGTSPGTPSFRIICGVGIRRASPHASPAVAVQEPSTFAVNLVPPNTPTVAPIADQDGDGIEDSKDACPTLPGPSATHGCPDADGDGIPDHLDSCPHEQGPAENHGCPVARRQLVVITQDKLVIKQKVHFAPGLAKLLPDSAVVLDQVAKVIIEHPSLELISIEGHTDSRGGQGLNLPLSQTRAQSVYTYLITAGVEARRLRTIGYGSDHPLATNKTAEGREANRRVEFVIAR